jgi:hypothetical protein
MFRLSSVALVLLLFVPNAVGQKSRPWIGNDASPFVRDPATKTGFAGRCGCGAKAQIFVYRLHEQEMAVERATKRWENAKSAVAQTQMQRKYNSDELKRLEGNKDRIKNEQQRKQYSDERSNIRDREEAPQAQEQELQSSQFGLEQQLKIEQAKLQQLQDQRDRLDKDFENSALHASSRRP